MPYSLLFSPDTGGGTLAPDKPFSREWTVEKNREVLRTTAVPYPLSIVCRALFVTFFLRSAGGGTLALDEPSPGWWTVKKKRELFRAIAVPYSLLVLARCRRRNSGSGYTASKVMDCQEEQKTPLGTSFDVSTSVCVAAKNRPRTLPCLIRNLSLR